MFKTYKYKSTKHLPFSPGVSSDDKVHKSTQQFEGKEVVATLKMDGENSSLYRHGTHAKSMDSRHHPSRAWLKAYHATFAHEIPEGWRICGENLYAKHSIGYSDLPSYFMGFSVWDESNTALSWDDSVEFMELLGLTPVPVLYRGVYDEVVLKKLANSLDLNNQEGFVVRLAGRIPYAEFSDSLAKWVRAGHVQTDEHWMNAAVVPNGLKAQGA